VGNDAEAGAQQASKTAFRCENQPCPDRIHERLETREREELGGGESGARGEGYGDVHEPARLWCRTARIAAVQPSSPGRC
jgi:hypothetical protein